MIEPAIGFIDARKAGVFQLAGDHVYYPGWLFSLEVLLFMHSMPSFKPQSASFSALWKYFFKTNLKLKIPKKKTPCLWSGSVQPSWRFFYTLWNWIYNTHTFCISSIQHDYQEIIVLQQNYQVRGQYVAICVHSLFKCFFFRSFTGYIVRVTAEFNLIKF